MLPAKFEVVGISRKEGGGYFKMDVENAAEYTRLAQHLGKLEAAFEEPAQRLYYLAVPPSAVLEIVAHLGESGLLEAPHAKLLLEKPFGIDLASAETHIAEVAKYAHEEQVYRVDHYLAKALAGRLIAAKQEGNWNKDSVRSIEIIALEDIGIEDRAGFYEQVGVLGDVIQSHLMELLATLLMEVPESTEDTPTARCAALAQITPLSALDGARAQYEGYLEEVGNPSSVVPTAAAINLRSTDPSWAGVALSITAGKALAEKRTEVRIIHTDGREEIMSAEPDTFPSGYPQLLLSAIAGEHERFTSSCEVLASWHALDALMQAWRASGVGLAVYPRGSSALQ